MSSTAYTPNQSTQTLPSQAPTHPTQTHAPEAHAITAYTPNLTSQTQALLSLAHPPTYNPCGRYQKLMLRRINWNQGREEEEEAAEGGDPAKQAKPPNYCHLVWQVRGHGELGRGPAQHSVCSTPWGAAHRWLWDWALPGGAPA